MHFLQFYKRFVQMKTTQTLYFYHVQEEMEGKQFKFTNDEITTDVYNYLDICIYALLTIFITINIQSINLKMKNYYQRKAM